MVYICTRISVGWVKTFVVILSICYILLILSDFFLYRELGHIQQDLTFHASEFYCSEAASTEHDVCLLYTMQWGYLHWQNLMEYFQGACVQSKINYE